jgi:hypothetical protein
MRSDSGRYLPTQLDDDFLSESLRRSLPWTIDDYEQLRKAVLTMVRTHTPWDLADMTRPSFDGKAYWAVLGALDRTHRMDAE